MRLPNGKGPRNGASRIQGLHVSRVVWDEVFSAFEADGPEDRSAVEAHPLEVQAEIDDCDCPCHAEWFFNRCPYDCGCHHLQGLPKTPNERNPMTHRMNPEVKAQWIEALESGEYTQGRGALTKVGPDGSRSHCCLGVLTDLAVKAGKCEETGRDLLDSIKYGAHVH